MLVTQFHHNPNHRMLICHLHVKFAVFKPWISYPHDKTFLSTCDRWVIHWIVAYIIIQSLTSYIESAMTCNDNTFDIVKNF